MFYHKRQIPAFVFLEYLSDAFNHSLPDAGPFTVQIWDQEVRDVHREIEIWVSNQKFAHTVDGDLSQSHLLFL